MKISQISDIAMLQYAGMDSPVGRLYIVAGVKGVYRIVLPTESLADILGELSKKSGAEVLERGDLGGNGSVIEESDLIGTYLHSAIQELEEYFSGDRAHFDVSIMVDGGDSFRQHGQIALAEIPYGKTWTYLELATRLGSPKAARAAGSSCATNLLPIILPCHRVVPTSGGFGSYRGGVKMKEQLLSLEGYRG